MRVGRAQALEDRAALLRVHGFAAACVLPAANAIADGAAAGVATVSAGRTTR
jgi:hypothetical protein